ncbi:helix-turn-helix transcriptional regulator [Actinoplanes sp. NEAU-A12]|uniref:Helix-turn-helix transcriptional regulator n=1 Tax=Actinoplanes sandaracinus TaxID=3045177 RepID=A0ABT6WHY5_9ACTN|nr:helix-turn-helix transcriptional regulator [Actinoplanes sandaracinus]MDI6099339.1 helix-turn-helix transcriptional regulator [Actinoplanes sandaracinus]
MSTFGQTLRQHRQGRRISLRELGKMTSFGFTFLSQIERGERNATEKLAHLCDEKLNAEGVLVSAYWNERAGKEDMHRRADQNPRRPSRKFITASAVGGVAPQYGRSIGS